MTKPRYIQGINRVKFKKLNFLQLIYLYFYILDNVGYYCYNKNEGKEGQVWKKSDF